MNQQFHIYHSTGKDRFQEIEIQPRVYAGFVYANTLEEAFKLSQTDFNSDWDTRSTSIGDVIQADDGFYMVLGKGFKLLDNTSKNDSELNSLESTLGQTE
jgi:hypothetical protein